MDQINWNVFERFARAIPYHEAGHALVGRACGRTLLRITTKPDDKGILGCYFLPGEKITAESNHAGMLAGPLAQIILCPGSLEKDEDRFKPNLLSNFQTVDSELLANVGWHADLDGIFYSLRQIQGRPFCFDNMTPLEAVVREYFATPVVQKSLSALGIALSKTDELPGQDAEAFISEALTEVGRLDPKLTETINQKRREFQAQQRGGILGQT
jgi:hypothetical protein